MDTRTQTLGFTLGQGLFATSAVFAGWYGLHELEADGDPTPALVAAAFGILGFALMQAARTVTHRGSLSLGEAPAPTRGAPPPLPRPEASEGTGPTPFVVRSGPPALPRRIAAEDTLLLVSWDSAEGLPVQA